MKPNIEFLRSLSDADIRQRYWYFILVKVIYGATVVWFCLLMPIIDNQPGFKLPNPDELHYSEGILEVRTQKVLKGGNYDVLLLKSPNKPTFTEYYCGYRARHYARSDDCFFKDKKVEHYIGQHATIGWYYQDRFLWMKNPHPQLVTLSVGDQQLRTYQQTKEMVERDRKGGYFHFIFLVVVIGIPFGYLYYILTRGARCFKEELNRRNNNAS